MLLAVVSDTHRDNFAINKILKKIENADILIHLGDNTNDAEEMTKKFHGKVIYVKGNCDFIGTVENEIIEVIDGIKIFITHGHRYDVKHDINKLLNKAKEEGAHIALYGHTHISRVDFENGIWIINPGSAAEARDGYESIALIEIDQQGIHPNIVAI